MRMRRKRNLETRIENCEGFFLDLNDEENRDLRTLQADKLFDYSVLFVDFFSF